MMPTTMLLDRSAWDLTLNADRNWALATEPYSVVQDVASACRLWAREAWYDNQNPGTPYPDAFSPINFLKAQLVAAALTVPGVVSARVFLTDLRDDRSIGGQVQVVLSDGSEAIATL